MPNFSHRFKLGKDIHELVLGLHAFNQNPFFNAVLDKMEHCIHVFGAPMNMDFFSTILYLLSTKNLMGLVSSP